MSDNLLSIIVPVYNVEKYLERCIRSLEDQDLPRDQYEIIVVNDGSPDNSREVVIRLQTEYDNIILIDQENQGVSIARNNGMDRAVGEYLLMIDPDDYIESESLGNLLKKAQKNNLDVLYSGFEILDVSNNTIWQTDYRSKNEVLNTGVEAYFSVRGKKEKDPDRSVAIFYKKNLLTSNNIHYPENVPFLEDGLFLAKVFLVAERCGYDSQHLYKRTTRPGSATQSPLFYMEKSRKGFIHAAIELRDFAKKRNFLSKQEELLNHVTAKFVLLPIGSCVTALDWNGFKRVKHLIREAGFRKLKLEGVRDIYSILGKQFNFSLNWLFIFDFTRNKFKGLLTKFNKT